MNANTENEVQRRRKIRNTALLLGLIVIVFYAGFIAVGVLRS
jgi:uncharacterized membrane protein